MTRGRKEAAADSIPAWEWVVAAAGALLVVAILAALVREGTAPSAPVPWLLVDVEGPVPGGDPRAARVRVTNRSRHAAADVHLEAAWPGAQDSETGRAVLDYVPGHSSRRVTLVFAGPPAAGLRVRIAGYREP